MNKPIAMSKAAKMPPNLNVRILLLFLYLKPLQFISTQANWSPVMGRGQKKWPLAVLGSQMAAVILSVVKNR